MPIEKSNSVISNNITLVAGSGTTTTSSVDCTTGGQKTIFLELTNGATPPTSTPASAVVQGSADNINFYNFSTTFNGSLAANGVTSICFLVPLPIDFVRVVWTAAPDGNNITARAELTQLTERTPVDATGAFRTADPYSIFDSTLIESDEALFWDTSLTGSATSTWLQNQAAIRLRCTTANGDIAERQTKQYFPYEAGKSQRILISAIMGAIKANVTQRIGYFDDNNGIFWEQDGTNLKVALRTFTSGSAVTTYVNQSAWNIDKFDGTGASNITIDMSKIQMFFIDFTWMGSSRIRLGFYVNGVPYYCHQFQTANTGTNVWASRGTLPVRFYITNTAGTGSNTDLLAISAAVISEGGYTPTSVVRSVDNGTTSISVGSTLIPLLSLRLKSGNNRATIVPLSTTLFVTNNADIKFEVIINGSLTGASFASVSSTAYSEFDTAATAISGGEIIASGYLTNGNYILIPLVEALRVVANIAGTADIITIAAVRVGATSANTLAELSYKEFA